MVFEFLEGSPEKVGREKADRVLDRCGQDAMPGPTGIRMCVWEAVCLLEK